MYTKAIAKQTAIIVLALVLAAFPVTVIATMNVKLAWDPNTESNLAGYRLYVREAGEAGYFYPAEWEGSKTTCTIEGLDRHESYYFVVRAVDTTGKESGNSNEVFLAANDDEDQNDSANDHYRGLSKSSGGSSGGSGGGCFISSLPFGR